ncbi:Crp/Fnr family transcriptional regulator [Paenibacillus thalictri]|uniref:Crp/Fnr family transcriptional regulator n=1 Tax=Paenibacillus thalictri TaxID=2527873 RepID=A0A4Q9DJ42_9BACL|nr:Crp/Fnr family transcriptional regulator [Paenibacillus thalictri]TBL73949.1 Crp/Fnr family transcriptional regulator [Paenibacillus thalictri]
MSALQPEHIRRICGVFPSFSSVSAELWHTAELVAVTPDTPHSVREGHVLQHAMFIVGGSIRVYKISSSGREITLYRVQGGQCCVLMMASIMGDMEYEASVSVETESEVLLIPVPLFKSWMDTVKPFRQFIYRQFVERMTKVTALLEQVAFQPVPCRIAAYLLRHSEHADRLHITHERLAIELGTAREVVSRVLKDFAEKGAIASQRGKITILNRSFLTAMSEPPL